MRGACAARLGCFTDSGRRRARADILAVRADMGAEQPERPMIEGQVKTMRHHRKPMWPMGARGITPAASAREWYVFVLLGQDVRDRPRCWVVPRVHVVAGAWIGHMHWLTEPGIPAGQRNAPITQARIGLNVWGRYEERWDLLDQSAYDAPVLLPDWIMDKIGEPRMAFPEAHRWRQHGVPVLSDPLEADRRPWQRRWLPLWTKRSSRSGSRPVAWCRSGSDGTWFRPTRP